MDRKKTTNAKYGKKKYYKNICRNTSRLSKTSNIKTWNNSLCVLSVLCGILCHSSKFFAYFCLYLLPICLASAQTVYVPMFRKMGSGSIMFLICPFVCACIWACQRKHSLNCLPMNSLFRASESCFWLLRRRAVTGDCNHVPNFPITTLHLRLYSQ